MSAPEMTDAERAEVLDWVKACEGHALADSKPEGPIRNVSGLAACREGLMAYVETLVAARVQAVEPSPAPVQPDTSNPLESGGIKTVQPQAKPVAVVSYDGLIEETGLVPLAPGTRLYLCAAPVAQADHVAGVSNMVPSPWISVSERLPQPDVEVLAVMRGKSKRSKPVVTISAVCPTDGAWYCIDDSMIYPKVTHWMAMPAAPGEQP